MDLASEARADGTPDEGSVPVLLEKLENVTPGEHLEITLLFIQQQAARVLAREDEDLPDPRRPLNGLGFDSLTAVEFCNAVGRSIGKHLNPTVLFDYPTLEGLAGYLVRDVLDLEPDATEEKDSIGEREDDAAEIREQTLQVVEEMTEEEMDALVAEQLGRLQQ
jgi:polyketide synthase 12/myxalamid-type polyketide synthase MxaB